MNSTDRQTLAGCDVARSDKWLTVLDAQSWTVRSQLGSVRARLVRAGIDVVPRSEAVGDDGVHLWADIDEKTNRARIYIEGLTDRHWRRIAITECPTRSRKMGESHDTGIEWTHLPGHRGDTWNPVRGCQRVSEGCRHCYAATIAARFSGDGLPYEGLAEFRNGRAFWTGEGMVLEEKFDEPLRKTKPRCYFVNSMSDLFFEHFAFDIIAAIYGVMVAARRHKFQVLTKRPERAVEFFEWLRSEAKQFEKEQRKNPRSSFHKYFKHFNSNPVPIYLLDHASRYYKLSVLPKPGEQLRTQWPPSNVALGVSAEDQEQADERVWQLCEMPAAVRFVSIEPMLGPITLAGFQDWEWNLPAWVRSCPRRSSHSGRPTAIRWLEDTAAKEHTRFSQEELPPDAVGECGYRDSVGAPCGATTRWHEVGHIDWVVVGGESGPNARPLNPDWVRQLRDECHDTRTPFFFKQWGAWRPLREGDEAPMKVGHWTPCLRPERETIHEAEAARESSLNIYGDEVPEFEYFYEGLTSGGEPHMVRAGKKESGRELDGETHTEWPEDWV